MSRFDYFNMLSNESTSNPLIYQQCINEYKTGKYDVEKDIVLGIKNRSVLETADMMRIHQLISRDPEIVKKIILYFKNNRDKEEQLFSYIPPLLNELAEDTREELSNSIISNYEKEIANHGNTREYQILLSIIKERFKNKIDEVIDDEFDNIMKEIESDIDVYEKDSIRIEVEDRMNESNYYQLYKSGQLDEAFSDKIKEAGKKVKDGVEFAGRTARYVAERGIDNITAAGHKIGKGVEHIEHIINKIRKRMEEKRRHQYYKRYFNDEWRLKRAASRLLVLVPVSMIAPVAGLLLYFYTKIFDFKNDFKHRRKAHDDVKLELKIIERKIRDAEDKGDKTAVIEMMRIQDKLERVKRNLEKNINV